MKTWQMQEAKAKFSELIKNVVNKEPQLISVRGKPTVVVISFDKYKNLMSNKISFIELMRNSPTKGEFLINSIKLILCLIKSAL